MPQPTDTSILVRGALQEVSIGYKNESYIADQVFPIINGLGRLSKVAKYNKGAWYRNEAAYRAPGTEARRGGYTVTTENLDPKQIAFAKEVTKEIAADAATAGNLPLRPAQEAIMYTADKVDLFKEKTIADLIFAQTWADGNLGGEDAGGLWAATDTTNTLVTDVVAGKQAIRTATGKIANTLVMDYDTMIAQTLNVVLSDKIKYTQTSVMTPALLASLLELDQVIIGSAVYSTADENADNDDFTAANIWEKNAGKGSAFLCYRPASAGLFQASPGYQYRLMVEGMNRRTYSWYDNAIHSTIYETQEDVDLAVVDTACGYLWKDTHTT